MSWKALSCRVLLYVKFNKNTQKQQENIGIDMQLTSIVVRLLKRSHGRITMFEQQPTLQLLFEQLGLDSDDASIENFIRTHQLPAEQKLHEASFWSQGQK